MKPLLASWRQQDFSGLRQDFPCTDEEISSQVWEVMWKPWLLSLRLPGLLVTVTSLVPTAGPLHSLTFLVIQVCKPTSSQLSRLVSFSGTSLLLQALHFEINHGIPRSPRS